MSVGIPPLSGTAPQVPQGRSGRPEGWRRGFYSVTLGALVFEFQPAREQSKNPSRPNTGCFAPAARPRLMALAARDRMHTRTVVIGPAGLDDPPPEKRPLVRLPAVYPLDPGLLV
jgi:hypothetical protein